MSTYRCTSQVTMFSTMFSIVNVNALLRRKVPDKTVLHQFSRTFPNLGGRTLLDFSTKTSDQQNPANSADIKTLSEPSPLSDNQQNGVKDRLLEKMTTGKVGEVVSAFEEFLGIGDVKRAQAKLIQVKKK